jgi:DNA-binding CsgD family transcriptional regulator
MHRHLRQQESSSPRIVLRAGSLLVLRIGESRLHWQRHRGEHNRRGGDYHAHILGRSRIFCTTPLAQPVPGAFIMEIPGAPQTARARPHPTSVQGSYGTEVCQPIIYDLRVIADEETKEVLIALFAGRKAYALSAALAAGTQAVKLTPREREALQWIAAGKTSWEASMILRVSEKAIDKIIASAVVKLNAVTRAQSVANAIRAGEVEL